MEPRPSPISAAALGDEGVLWICEREEIGWKRFIGKVSYSLETDT